MLRAFATILLLMALLSAPGEAFAQAAGFYYTVQKTETLSTVARRFGMSESELARQNRMKTGARLVRGTNLWIPRSPKTTPIKAAPVKKLPAPVVTKTTSSVTKVSPAPTASDGSTYTVRSGDSLWGVANRHGMTVDQLAKLNGISTKAGLQVGQKLIVKGEQEIPGGGVAYSPAEPAVVASAPDPAPVSQSSGVSSSGTRPSSRGYIWPLEGRILRSYVNRADEKYTGIDIAAPRGSEVRAAKDGTILYAGDGIPSYGRMVIVSHDGEIATCYAQLDRALVKKDQSVKRGQVIGRSGDLGKGREPYLHFEIRRGGEAIDPEPYLP